METVLINKPITQTWSEVSLWQECSEDNTKDTEKFSLYYFYYLFYEVSDQATTVS